MILKQFFILIVILGVSEVTFGNEENIYSEQLERPQCHLLCGLCRRIGRLIKIFLEDEPFIPLTSRVLYQMCKLIPERHWRNECLDITHYLPRKIHEFADHINVTLECSELGFCHHKHTMLSNSEITSCINDHINYGLSLANSPKYKETIIKNICTHHAADKHKCFETIESIITFLLEITI
ncbi:unnamed protein product [Schistosoma rodhaini]|uniref:Saposin B-type domain-containing protein n=1 Tax=Schistosoma mansoni TaxID=6183 RepID=G4VHH1_SCHMA|nr:hypothetical protein Smp_194910 [Schistosoma mansoni]CAH8503852.1 unnamed protein product [Schistosoma rodhaini]|eukprot:XP_018652438.1 hypothetical protein Smp_194910 [Schistosoma mansoni]